MFYEDVKIEAGESLWKLAVAYGYKGTDWTTIWENAKNADLVKKRKLPNLIQPGDILQVPIPWTIVSGEEKLETDGASIVLRRDGELGTRLTWVQTVDAGNQSIAPDHAEFAVDATVPDDDLPFYWTNAEIARDPTRRKEFRDRSRRPAPTAAQGTTKWRGTVSLAVVTGQRVTFWDSMVWGWDRTPAGVVTMIPMGSASVLDKIIHLVVLSQGKGTGPAVFSAAGWTFRPAFEQ